MNESRPGVCSTVLSPEEASVRFTKILCSHPETTVIGIAGPGEPLANGETFETIRLLRRRYPSMHYCVSTNGLYLPEKAETLYDLGVRFLTVTVNTLNPETGSVMYEYVSNHGKVLRGTEAARQIMNCQKDGIRKSAALGMHIKINTVLVDAVNSAREEVEQIAKSTMEWGAELHNMNSVINVTGDQRILPVSVQKLRELRKYASAYLPQMNFCRQCRADAAGIPGKCEGTIYE